MKSPLHVVLWMCLTVGTMPWAFAQEVDASIANIYKSALANNPALRAQGQRLEAFKAGREHAERWNAGPLSLQGSYRSDRNFDNQGLRETELGLSAPLWLWNERSRNQAFRQAELDASERRAAQLKLDLAGQVRQVYWNALAAQLDVDIAKSRLAASEKLISDVQRRVGAGDLAKVDLLQATALHAQASAELGRAMSALATLGAAFTEVTGLPVSILGTLGTLRMPAGEALPASTSPDLQAHPAYLALQSEVTVESSRASLVAVQQRENPEVGLAVVNDRAAFAAGSEKSLMLSTRIPLGSSAEHDSRLLAARANETEAQERLKRFAITLKAQAIAAQANVEWFEKLQANAQQQAVLARQEYTLYQQSFSLGETDLPALLRFEQQAFEAERLAKKSTLEYSTKVSALRQALGLLPEQAP